MEEENKDLELDSKEQLVKEYQRLQNTTVSKEKYKEDIQKIQAERDMYLKAITEGSKVETPEENNSSLEELAEKQAKFRGTNLDYWKETVPYIKRIVKEVPQEQITKIAGQNGLKELIKVGNVMGKMVEDAENDPIRFRSLYRMRIEDSSPEISTEIERAGSTVNYLEQQNKE